jgi:hypothetical protein
MKRAIQISTFATMASVFMLAFVGLGAQGCPREPVVPGVTDGGAGGTVVTDAAPPPPPPTCVDTESMCCRSCLVLLEHQCTEGQPTAKGATCEERCQAVLTGPERMRLPDISACTNLACIRSPGQGKRGIACEGGK